MALQFYSDSGLTTVITSVTTTHDSAGESKEVRVFLGNTNPSFTYEEIEIAIEDTSGTDESDWVQLALDNAGVPGTYEDPGETLTHPNITDNLAHGIWIKVTTPNVGSAQNKTDLRLVATFKEFAV